MIILVMMIIIIIITTTTTTNNNNNIQRSNSRSFSLLTTSQTVSRTFDQMAMAPICENHVQHVVCHVVRRDSSTIKYDRVKKAFLLTLFYWQTINR